MNIKKYKFGKIGFCMETDKKLLAEAVERGFYNGKTKYNTIFSELFFGGGKLNFKKDIDAEFRKNCTEYLKSFMQSFSPRYEEKEAISAMLLSELVDA